MDEKKSLSYRDAGVDIDMGNELAKEYISLQQSTFGPQVLRNDGGFGGLYQLRGLQGLFARVLRDPVLVSGTDGVGTKLKIAFMMDKHDTVGIDLVAMSVNDVLVQGAEPLFFLDYVATGKVEKGVLLDIVRGVSEGCRQSNCALLGGETAELPGFYQDGEYDLAGFAVGIVEKRGLVNGSSIQEGDVIIGIPSSGIHSNGYSLARKAILEAGGYAITDKVAELGCTVGEELLRPTTIYAKPVLDVLKAYRRKKPVHGMVHITGGGLIENVPRILPKTVNAVFDRDSWNVLPVFDLIAKSGNVEDEEMLRVFNMGLGYIMVVSEAHADAICRRLKAAGSDARAVGHIATGTGVVEFKK